jgi:hypothetical protein
MDYNLCNHRTLNQEKIMNRKERLYNTFQGKTVDRPAVSFYEINGYSENPEDPDKYNIYNDPSWKPLIDLAREKTDRMACAGASVIANGECVGIYPPGVQSIRMEEIGDSRHIYTTVKAGKKTLTSHDVREKDVNTSWRVEHLIKSLDDLKAWAAIPDSEFKGAADISKILQMEKDLGDTGCPILDLADPLCIIAYNMAMEDYTVFAMTEEKIFREALDKAARYIFWLTEQLTAALPGRLWRIVGPEFAGVPYLPPSLFHEYVYNYDKTMVEIVNKSGGYARVHCHGNLRAILNDIAAAGCMGLDPVEPPPQGDVELSYVREKYGKQLVLFGNLEASDIENLKPELFREKVKTALDEGTRGNGRGFVLMPSACPYGRNLSSAAMKNYEVMIEEIERF